MKGTDCRKLVTAITTVVVVVTFPILINTMPIEAGELELITAGPRVHNAVLVIVGQIPVAFVRTLTLGTIWTWSTDMAASSVELVTRIATLLPLGFDHCGNTTRLGGQTCGHRYQV